MTSYKIIIIRFDEVTATYVYCNARLASMCVIKQNSGKNLFHSKLPEEKKVVRV